jgi:hypothetical protein
METENQRLRKEVAELKQEIAYWRAMITKALCLYFQSTVKSKRELNKYRHQLWDMMVNSAVLEADSARAGIAPKEAKCNQPPNYHQ